MVIRPRESDGMSHPQVNEFAFLFFFPSFLFVEDCVRGLSYQFGFPVEAVSGHICYPLIV